MDATGFEPVCSGYRPDVLPLNDAPKNTPSRIRTCIGPVSKRVLYPLSYGGVRRLALDSFLGRFWTRPTRICVQPAFISGPGRDFPVPGFSLSIPPLGENSQNKIR